MDTWRYTEQEYYSLKKFFIDRISEYIISTEHIVNDRKLDLIMIS